ncbi:hypothetical protein AQUCO_02800021v1 [Aquilegia coerulea]|uniref:F-box domain-containing protein n=1 Tax=Aquilegia coerulea TaxID=218851 RepID=A0A2G5D3L5_AQUCA|nr:hypothetical protein AQUCO_02800021v1 [Aquilegia coerulea]
MKSRKKLASSSNSPSGDENNDRLSSLPQEILQHIISFDVDAKQVIQMSILSKRWRYFWTSLISISINSNVFYSYPSYRDKNKKYISFDDFVIKVLRGGSPNDIHKLKVFSSNHKCSNINSYVCIAVQRNVQELILSFDRPCFKKLDLGGSLIFSCKSLTSLVLELDINGKENCVKLKLPGLVDMPVLKNLKLQFIAMLSTEFFGKFFSGCPVLERLEFSNCEFDESKDDLVISGIQLKHLVIEECLSEDDFCGLRIVVSAPNLISFKCVDYMLNDYHFKDLSCLETVYVDMCASYIDDDAEAYYGFEVEEAERTLGVLKGLYNVKSLTLAPRVLKEVSRAQDILNRPPVSFDNLKYLEVTWISEDHMQAIKYIFENCQNIETFVIGNVGVMTNPVIHFILLL